MFGLITELIWVDFWIFIWSMNFLLMYFKILYDFMIRFYDLSLYYTFRAVSKIAILTTLDYILSLMGHNFGEFPDLISLGSPTYQAQ
jgi:hypothetical protein